MVIKWIIHPQNWHLHTIVSFHGVGPHLLSVTSSGQSKTYLLSPPHVTWILSVLSNQHQPQNSCNSLDSRHWVRLIRIYTISNISKSFWRNPPKTLKTNPTHIAYIYSEILYRFLLFLFIALKISQHALPCYLKAVKEALWLELFSDSTQYLHWPGWE